MQERQGVIAMQTSEASKANAQATAARSQQPRSAPFGGLLSHCAIDLPPNDVIESIDFERFFVINARLSELQRPLTLMSVLASNSQKELSRADLTALGSSMPIAAL